MLQVGIELLESNSTIANKIKKALVVEFEKALKKSTLDNRLEEQIKVEVYKAFIQQPEYQSLAFQGKLAKALGLEDGEAAIAAVIDILVGGISVKFLPVEIAGTGLKADIWILSTYSIENITTNPVAFVETKKGQQLPWLEWLLKEGDSRFLKGYSIYYAPIPKPRSRAGGAIMVQDDGAAWGVPAEFAGTEEDNFITRAFALAGERLDGIIKTELTKGF